MFRAATSVRAARELGKRAQVCLHQPPQVVRQLRRVPQGVRMVTAPRPGSSAQAPAARKVDEALNRALARSRRSS